MGIKYFYNFCISKLDDLDLEGDILSAVRKSYFNDFDKIRDKITYNSEGEYHLYDYCIEKDKPLKWTVSMSDGTVLQDVNEADGGRYHICFYKDSKLIKRLLFSRLHTLLRVEYTDESGAICASLEPRKLRDGLCLLYKDKELPRALVLKDAPGIADEKVAERVRAEFTDYTAVASTNEGIVLYLSEDQLNSYNSFVSQVEKEINEAPEQTFIYGNSPLLDKINAKDFNVKRNLSSSLDITQAREFGKPAAQKVTEEPKAEENEEIDDKSIEAVVRAIAQVQINTEPVEEAKTEETDINEPETAVAEPAIETDTVEEPENDIIKPDKLVMADGAMYKYYGELDDNGNRSGYGRTLTDLGKTAYEGSYENDKRSGKGSYYYKDGSLCYSGDWLENARHGVGVGISARDGSMHIGHWKNNVPEGNGVRVSADGVVKFVCKELPDGKTVLTNYTDDDTLVISIYDKDGNKTGEKTVSLINF